jgi:hypothetical protein
MDYLPVSRRDFCRGAVAASSLAVGFPSRALAFADRTPTNVRVSHDGHDDHVEPCLAMNPRDPRNRLGVGKLGNEPPATYSSFDGGRTWRSNGPLPLRAGLIGGGNNTVGFDGDGGCLACSLLVQPPSPDAPKGLGFQGRRPAHRRRRAHIHGDLRRVLSALDRHPHRADAVGHRHGTAQEPKTGSSCGS